MTKVNVLKRLLPIAVLALLSTGLFAKGKICINSYLRTDYAIITARPDVAESYRIKILNDEGAEMYASSRIKGAASFQKLFDLSSLADGNYRIELTSKNTTSVEKFSVVSHKLVRKDVEEKESELLTAFFRVAKEKLYVSHMNFEQAALRISIDDANGTEIYNSSLPKESAYSGMFDLTKLPSGEYQVTLVSGKNEYNYEFNK